MRIIIFCDMEGVSCIETWEQVMSGTALYQECRKLYTDEMNAAVRGAIAAGRRCYDRAGQARLKPIFRTLYGSQRCMLTYRNARCSGSKPAQLAQALQSSQPCYVQGGTGNA